MLVLVHGGGSEAAWLGANGRIVYADPANGGIWIMDADGGNRQQLTTGSDFFPSWSPDGSTIVFEREALVTQGGNASPGIPPDIHYLRIDTVGEPIIIGSGQRPAYTPDGLNTVSDFNEFIQRVPIDGIDPVRITSDDAWFDTAPVSGPELADPLAASGGPDGPLIAFLRKPFELTNGPVPLGLGGGPGAPPTNDIWTTTPDGLSQTQITNTPLVSEGASDWSPTGDRLTYTDDTGIVVRTFPGNVTQTIFPALPGAYPDDPVFSPDGTTIAFTLVEFPINGISGAVSLTRTIYTIPAGGGTATAVPGSGANPAELHPDWEPVSPPTPSPTPAGPTPIVRNLVWGDDQCDGEANPVDSLITLRSDAALPVQLNGCPPMNQDIIVLVTIPVGGPGADPQNWGNVDCDASITPVDGLKILRYDAGLSVSQNQPCPPIGDGVQVQYGP